MSGGGWQAVDAAVATARVEVAAAAPDAATAVEGEAYVMRVLSGCLSDAFLGHLFVEGGLTRALAIRGGPNPDYRMSHAAVDSTRRYRLEGQLNGSERVGVGLYSFGAGGSTDLAGYAAFDAASTDKDGRFALDLAAEAQSPEGLAIPPEARVVMMRTLHRDPDTAPAHLILTGASPPRDLTLANGNFEAALDRVAAGLLGAIRTYLEWSDVISRAVNRFHVEMPAMAQGIQGDSDTIYFFGSYLLGDGEWLEISLPADIAGYWSIQAYNHWCESLPGAGIGDSHAVPDADGWVRIAVGPSVDGLGGNRIDTIGRRRGVLIGRFIGAAGIAVPRTAVHRH